MTTKRIYPCYTCDGVLKTREERQAGERHVCKKKKRAPHDWVCTLDYVGRDPLGLFGSWVVEIKDGDGGSVKGLQADLRSCLELVQMQGFSRRRMIPSDRAADKLGWARR
tara:strand:+ start:6521 stop:6850 length:330 start_codon:yes stop_codon:yes gene_type:complete